MAPSDLESSFAVSGIYWRTGFVHLNKTDVLIYIGIGTQRDGGTLPLPALLKKKKICIVVGGKKRINIVK